MPIFIIIWVMGQFALAQQPVGESWQGPIETLIAQGVTQIGDFNLQRFYREASKIEWSTFDGQMDETQFEGRSSAYFTTEGRRVSVSTHLPESSVESYELLELHEALGAVGYKDSNYELSTGLHLLSKLPQSDFKSGVFDHFDQDLFLNTRESGTGTSVGGGGDLTAVAVKYAVLQRILKTYSQVSVSFAADFPKISFEPMYVKDQQFVALRYQTDLKRELISVYVPALIWIRKPNQRGEIIKNLIEKVTEIFPVATNVSMHQVQPVTCAGAKSVAFPKSTSVQTLSIQSFRASFISGCETMFGFMDVRIPAFKLPSEIPDLKPFKVEPSVSPYVCQLDLNTGKLPIEFELTNGRLNSKIHATYVSRKTKALFSQKKLTLVMLQLIANEKGQLIESVLRLSDAHSKELVLNQRISFNPFGPHNFKFKTLDGIHGTLDCFSQKGGLY